MRIRMTNRLLVIGLFCGACVSVPQSVFAQGSSMFSGSGVTKSGTGGISGSLGGSGFGSSTSSGGGLNSSGLSSALGGALGGGNGGGANGLAGFGATGANGLNAANSGFVGRTGTAMAGNSRAGQNAGGNSGRTANRGGNSSNFNSSNQNSNNSNSMTKSSSIRPRQKVAFEYSVKSPVAVATAMTTRLDRITIKNPSLKQVGVQVLGNELVLSGTVKTEHDRRLAENLLRFEPGVKTIRNELEVEQKSAPAE